MEEHTENAEVLYQKRSRRIQDVVELREPDRVPFMPLVHYYVAKYAGITFQEAMHDLDKLKAAIEKMVVELQLDSCLETTFRLLSWAPPLKVLDIRQVVFPGHGLGPNSPLQFVENEYMKAEEYDDFLLDPTGFILSKVFPRAYGALAPFKNFPSVPMAYYARMAPFAAAFSAPEMAEAIASLMKSGAEAVKVLQKGGSFAKEMMGRGYPPQFTSVVYAPYDYIGDFFRGTKGIMLDMYRSPDKLLAMLERVYELLARAALSVPKMPGVNLVFMPLHKGLDGFMSLDQFKTFFWPTLKRMMLALLDAGFTPCPLWEGNCTSRLETISDMPKGKVVYWFEQTDLFKAKEIMGDRICLRGNVPASMLTVGTPQQVKEYCRKLIQVVGKGGGFILDGAIGIPDDSKTENVMAMVEAVREYGVY
jgi:uroporphyrinogen-III decarboxylase